MAASEYEKLKKGENGAYSAIYVDIIALNAVTMPHTCGGT
jgi:hypothetical protein